jgi:uncharacterized lipoprotein YajG
MLAAFSKNNTSFKSLLLLCVISLLAACSDSNNNNNNNNKPTDPVDPEFPDYTVVELEAGDDLETRALEALITADPKTIIQFPAGIYDFTG